MVFPCSLIELNRRCCKVMYRICIDEELKLDVYKKIIDFGLSKSDAFMLVTYRYSNEGEAMYSKPDRNAYDSEDEFLMFLNYFEQMKKERYDNEAIFKNNTEPFLEKLKPYLIKKRNFPTEWPSAKVVFYDKFTTVDICVYRVCDEIKPYLIEADGLFNWKYPYFPDDLCFF